MPSILLAAAMLLFYAPQQVANKVLFKAIRYANVAELKRLLHGGADPNTREVLYKTPTSTSAGGEKYLGDTALMVAVQTRNITTVKMLVDSGAKVNEEGMYHTTPLARAASAYWKEGLRFLVKKGADVNHMDEMGNVPIGYCVNAGDPEIVEILLTAGANPNLGEGMTPLMSAAYSGNLPVVKLLLKAGADPNLVRNGNTAVEYAQMQGWGDEAASAIRAAGGKGRSAEELRKDIDRLQKIEIEKMRVQVAAAAKEHAAEAAIRPDDALVLKVLFADLTTYHGEGLKSFKGSALWVLDNTLTNGGLSREDQEGQLDADTRDHAKDITSEMRSSLINRNYAAVLLADIVGSSVHLVSDKELQEFFGERRFKEGVLWVKLTLPGYSKSGDQAVLRFAFGPTPHGASGIYAFRKVRGSWVVQWREFAYYV